MATTANEPANDDGDEESTTATSIETLDMRTPRRTGDAVTPNKQTPLRATAQLPHE